MIPDITKYIVVRVEEDRIVPVYTYEFTATDTSDVNSASAYSTAELAKQAAQVLTQMSAMSGGNQIFEARVLTTTIREIEEEAPEGGIE